MLLHLPELVVAGAAWRSGRWIYDMGRKTQGGAFAAGFVFASEHGCGLERFGRSRRHVRVWVGSFGWS